MLSRGDRPVRPGRIVTHVAVTLKNLHFSKTAAEPSSRRLSSSGGEVLAENFDVMQAVK
jgi:hypothetical protein